MDCGMPCPSPSPGVCPSSWPLNQWCHPTISSSVTPFFRFQSFPASGSFPMSNLFTSGGQSTEASASASVLPTSIQGWFPLQLSSLICLLSKELLQNHSSKASILLHWAFFIAHPALTSTHDYWKVHSLDYMNICHQSDVFAFNTLSRFVITFLLQSPSTMVLEPKKRKYDTDSTFSLSICHEVMGPDAMILIFLIFGFKPAFPHSPPLLSSRGPLVPLYFLSVDLYHMCCLYHLYHICIICGCWYFSWKSWFQLVTYPAQYFAWCALHISNRMTISGLVVLLSQSCLWSLCRYNSASSKPHLNIWKFLVHILLRPSLEDFEHNLTSMGDKCNCLVACTVFSIVLLGNWDKDWPFPVLWPLLDFSNLLTYWVQHLNSIIF